MSPKLDKASLPNQATCVYTCINTEHVFFIYFCISEGCLMSTNTLIIICVSHIILYSYHYKYVILREFLDHKTRMVEKNRLAWWLIDTSITLLFLQSENVLKELVYRPTYCSGGHLIKNTRCHAFKVPLHATDLVNPH